MSDTNTAQLGAQLPLFPPDVLEFTLKVGIVISGEHAQILYEVRDPVDDNLLRLETRHHVDLRSVGVALADYYIEMSNDVLRAAFPFLD